MIRRCPYDADILLGTIAWRLKPIANRVTTMWRKSIQKWWKYADARIELHVVYMIRDFKFFLNCTFQLMNYTWELLNHLFIRIAFTRVMFILCLWYKFCIQICHASLKTLNKKTRESSKHWELKTFCYQDTLSHDLTQNVKYFIS